MRMFVSGLPGRAELLPARGTACAFLPLASHGLILSPIHQ